MFCQALPHLSACVIAALASHTARVLTRSREDSMNCDHYNPPDQSGGGDIYRHMEGAMPDQAWDLRGADQLDHVGAQLLWDRWGRQWPARLELLPAQREVLERARQGSLPGVSAS